MYWTYINTEMKYVYKVYRITYKILMERIDNEIYLKLIDLIYDLTYQMLNDTEIYVDEDIYKLIYELEYIHVSKIVILFKIYVFI